MDKRDRLVMCALALVLGFYPYMGPAYAADIEPAHKEETVSPETSSLHKETGKKEQDKTDTADTGKNEVKSPAMEQALPPLDMEPLSEKDFTWKALKLGDSMSVVTHVMGMPDKIDRGITRQQAEWKNFSAEFKNALPSSVEKGNVSGMTRLRISGPAEEIVRNIHVGDSRETILRSLGRPYHVLLDGKSHEFYLLYKYGNEYLVFEIEKDKIKSGEYTNDISRFNIHKNSGYTVDNGITPDDLTIAGYRIGDTYEPHSWDSWDHRMSNNTEVIWYLSGYAVKELSSTHTIEMLSLIDNRMLTGRGLAAGDHKTTMERLYGAPDKIENSIMNGVLREAYIYFPKASDEVLLFYIVGNRVETVSVISHPKYVVPVVPSRLKKSK